VRRVISNVPSVFVSLSQAFCEGVPFPDRSKGLLRTYKNPMLAVLELKLLSSADVTPNYLIFLCFVFCRKKSAELVYRAT